MSDRIMSRKEVAEFIGRQCRADGRPVTLRTVSRYQRMGIPHMKLAGNTTFMESAVLKWIKREGAR